MTDSHPAGDIVGLNAWMKNYAAKVGAVYADYFTPMVDNRGWLKDELSGDGLHPNAEGYKVMTAIVSDAIQKALAK
jgi:lysophospholipase L1-like esterase